MLEDIAAYVRAGLEALSSQKPEDAAGAFVSRATGLAEQLTAFASGFLEWSAEARASLLQELRDVVTRQVEGMGLASKDDVDALRARVDRLETKAKSPTAASRTTGARTTASRKTAARTTRSRRTGARTPPSRKAGSRSGGRSSGSRAAASARE